jgi:hypothetical protein
MNLTRDQVQAIQSGQPVHLLEPQSNVDCVLLPASLYERVQALFEDVPLSNEERRALLAESGKRAGWDDPAMDVYDDYDANHS